MALVLLDRVQQTGTANTTVSFTLSGSVVGYQSFSAIGNGNTTFYAATDVSGNWEVGVGTYATGGTLTRTTVLSSSNSGSAVTFSGTVNVFVTYPSEQSVNLNASGNVSALGTITSGVWNGSTIPVAYGGTGVTASSGANSVVLRDANQNIYANSVTQELDVSTSAGGTTVLTAASSHFQILTGTTTQTFQLPDATTLATGSSWVFDNDSTGNLFVVNAASGAVDTVAPGGYATVFLETNGTVAGEWGRYGMIPSEVNWGTNSLDMGGSTVITNGVWQGTPVASGYGGTGLTTFSAANNALYSTGASTLTAGTLPVLAGGTGTTTSTGSGNVVLSTSPTLVTPALGTPSSGNLANCTGYPAGSISGTVAIANGGTGQTTAGAAFNALSPITSTGDLILGNGTNSSTRLAIGSSGYVLTSNGTTASWTAPATGGGTITTTDFTATAGQTTFTVNYTVGSTEVYQNGAKLGIADFTATNGTSIILATGAAVGDLIEVVSFSVLNLYSTITYDDFNGDGTTTVFTMSAVPANAASLLVAISGVVQDPGTYTVSSTTLTFTTAPPAGTGNISIRYLGVASVGTVGSFSAGTTGLTPASATTGAVVLGGTLNVANGGTGLNTLASGRIPYGAGTSAFGSSANLTYSGTNLIVNGTTASNAAAGITIGSISTTPSGLNLIASGQSGLYYGDAVTGTAAYEGYIEYYHSTNSMALGTNHAERMRIDDKGWVGIGGGYNAITNLQGRVNISANSGALSDSTGIIAAPTTTESFLVAVGQDSAALRLTTYAGGTNWWNPRTYAGTLASPTAVGANTTIWSVSAAAYNGVSYAGAQRFGVRTFNAQSATDLSSYWYFQTTASGATSSRDVLYVKDSGNLEFQVADAGIKFNKTGALVSSTLNDYEEGTWTPTIIGTTTAGTATYAQNAARYTKIGRLVFVETYLVWSGGTGSGNLRLAGLPFTAANVDVFPGFVVSYFENVAMTANNFPMVYVIKNSTEAVFAQCPTGGGTNNNIPYDAAGSIQISGCYSV